MIRLCAGAVAAVLLAGCSSSDGGTKSGAVSGFPECSDVWVDGKTIPDGYRGCHRPGSNVVAVSLDCKDGSKIFTYEPDGDGFYTKPDGTIVEAGEDYSGDPAYAALFRACS